MGAGRNTGENLTSAGLESSHLHITSNTSSSSFIFLTLSCDNSSTSEGSLRSMDLNFRRAGRSTPLGAHSSMRESSERICALREAIYFFLLLSDFFRLLYRLMLSESFLEKFSLSSLTMAS